MKIKVCKSKEDLIKMMTLFDKMNKESNSSWLGKLFKDSFGFSFNKEIKTPFIFLEKENIYIFDICIYKKRDFIFEIKSNRCFTRKDFNFNIKQYETLFDFFIKKFILEWGE